MINPEYIEPMLMAGLSQSDAYSKALANFMLRELVEDIHCKYDISEEDMKQMCKRAVDRASLYHAVIEGGSDRTKLAFCIYASVCDEWDDAEYTEDIQDIMGTITACEAALKKAEELTGGRLKDIDK